MVCDLKDDTGASFSLNPSSGTSSDPINATFYTKTTSDGLGDNLTYGVYVDGSGNIYAATTVGLSISN